MTREEYESKTGYIKQSILDGIRGERALADRIVEHFDNREDITCDELEEWIEENIERIEM